MVQITINYVGLVAQVQLARVGADGHGFGGQLVVATAFVAGGGGGPALRMCHGSGIELGIKNYELDNSLIQVFERRPAWVGRLIIIRSFARRASREDEFGGSVGVVIGFILEARMQLFHGQSQADVVVEVLQC